MGCIRLDILEQDYKSCEQKMFAVKNPLTFYKTENKERSCYVFGLVMSGISSRAANTLENKHKYNGIEYENSFDINIGEAFFRTHDPQLGRWWQIDPKLEASLNISPYAAMDNNPVIKSDPLGDIAIIDDAVIGFFKGLFRKRSSFEGGAKTRFGNALRSAGRHASNSAKIWGGLGTTDKHKSFFGQVGQLLSRFTWELPNTITGFTASHITNAVANVNSVDYEAGATVLNVGKKDFGAFTIGSFIIGDHNIEADPNNFLFQHEYGHYLQSQTFGPGYLFAFALPSLFSATLNPYSHNEFYTEQDANKRAKRYWERTIDDYKGWDNKFNKIVGGGGKPHEPRYIGDYGDNPPPWLVHKPNWDFTKR
jgi:RHS repeat-associated protein